MKVIPCSVAVSLYLLCYKSTFDPDYPEPDSDQTQTIIFNGPYISIFSP